MGHINVCLTWMVVISIIKLSYSATELLKNADLESTSYMGNWQGVGCQISPSNDHYQGSHSAHVYGRTQKWNGISQDVNVIGGRYYRASGFVKLLSNVHNWNYQNVGLTIGCQDHSGKSIYLGFGSTPHVQRGQWFEVGGAIQIPAGSHNCRIFFETDAPTEYLLDHATMQEVPHDTNWRTHANSRINQYRKADINLSLVGSGVDTAALSVELIQNTHEFAFGSAVDARMIVDGSHHAYQQQFYNTFEWSTLENAFKWTSMEHNQGHIDYTTPMTAANTLISHGIKVRGHCVFWADEKYTQDWVKGLSASALELAIDTRIQGVVEHTKGRLEHWDVNNEDLHWDFYERHTGDPNITMKMFRQVHAVDQHPKLFINEFSVLNNKMTVALKDQASRFKKAGVPIGGVGIQGHVHNIDLTLVQARLDIVAEAGLPIMITEFAVNDPNEVTKASKLNDYMLLFFGHPSVEGVIFWGFWDRKMWEHDAALFTGANATPNAAGRALQQLIHTTWRTHKTVSLHGNQVTHVRGFKGTYTLNVKHNGQILHTENFTLSGGHKDLQIHLNGQSGGIPSVSHVIVG